MLGEELKACPFCGLDVTDDEGCFPINSGRTLWEVRCGNPSCFAHEPSGESRDAAVAKWNRRSAAFEEMVRDAGRLDWLEKYVVTIKADGRNHMAGPGMLRSLVDTAMSAEGAKGE